MSVKSSASSSSALRGGRLPRIPLGKKYSSTDNGETTNSASPSSSSQQQQREESPQRAVTKDQTPELDVDSKRLRGERHSGVLHEPDGPSEDVAAVTREEQLGREFVRSREEHGEERRLSRRAVSRVTLGGRERSEQEYV